MTSAYSNSNLLTLCSDRRVIPEEEDDNISTKACLDDGYQLADYPNEVMEHFIDAVSASALNTNSRDVRTLTSLHSQQAASIPQF